MKEAIGELNTTVIVAVLVAMLSLLFFGVVLPSIVEGEDYSAMCSDAICYEDKVSDGMAECRFYHEDGEKFDSKNSENYDELTCPWKG